MICPNCKSETQRLTTVCDDDGKLFTFCVLCPRSSTERKIGFPAVILTSKRGRGRPSKTQDNKRFENYKLNDNEIRMTQSIAPMVRTVDTPATRQRDSIDVHKEFAFVETSAGRSSFRENIINRKLTNKFGNNNYKIISDNGFKVVAEAGA